MNPTNEQIIEVLQAYDKFICEQNGTECTSRGFAVTHRESIPNEGCELIHVSYKSDEESEYHPATTSVVAYEDGTIFCTEDWDFYPSVVDSISNYNWICANNAQRGVLFLGFPKLF